MRAHVAAGSVARGVRGHARARRRRLLPDLVGDTPARLRPWRGHCGDRLRDVRARPARHRIRDRACRLRRLANLLFALVDRVRRTGPRGGADAHLRNGNCRSLPRGPDDERGCRRRRPGSWNRARGAHRPDASISPSRPRPRQPPGSRSRSDTRTPTACSPASASCSRWRRRAVELPSGGRPAAAAVVPLAVGLYLSLSRGAILATAVGVARHAGRGRAGGSSLPLSRSWSRFLWSWRSRSLNALRSQRKSESRRHRRRRQATPCRVGDSRGLRCDRWRLRQRG